MLNIPLSFLLGISFISKKEILNVEVGSLHKKYGDWHPTFWSTHFQIKYGTYIYVSILWVP